MEEPIFEKTTTQEQTEKFQDDYLTVLDSKPGKLKTEVPVIIAPGWSENSTVYKDVIHELNQAERRVLSLAYAGAEDSYINQDFPTIEIGKALTLIQMLEDKGIDQTDIIAHSEGAISVIIAASLHPEKFRNIILSNPAGLIGKDTFPKLAGRFSVKTIQDGMRLFTDNTNRSSVFRLFKEGGKFIFRHPIQGLREAMAISQSDIYNVMNDLKQNNPHIKISMMAGVDDPVFPMEKFQSTMGKGVLDGFLSLKGGHDELHYQTQYARAAEYLLAAMEKS